MMLLHDGVVHVDEICMLLQQQHAVRKATQVLDSGNKSHILLLLGSDFMLLAS